MNSDDTPATAYTANNTKTSGQVSTFTYSQTCIKGHLWKKGHPVNKGHTSITFPC